MNFIINNYIIVVVFIKINLLFYSVGGIIYTTQILFTPYSVRGV